MSDVSDNTLLTQDKATLEELIAQHEVVSERFAAFDTAPQDGDDEELMRTSELYDELLLAIAANQPCSLREVRLKADFLLARTDEQHNTLLIDMYRAVLKAMLAGAEV